MSSFIGPEPQYPVPEPGVLELLVLGGGLLLSKRKKREGMETLKILNNSV